MSSLYILDIPLIGYLWISSPTQQAAFLFCGWVSYRQYLRGDRWALGLPWRSHHEDYNCRTTCCTPGTNVILHVLYPLIETNLSHSSTWFHSCEVQKQAKLIHFEHGQKSSCFRRGYWWWGCAGQASGVLAKVCLWIRASVMWAGSLRKHRLRWMWSFRVIHMSLWFAYFSKCDSIKMFLQKKIILQMEWIEAWAYSLPHVETPLPSACWT